MACASEGRTPATPASGPALSKPAGRVEGRVEGPDLILTNARIFTSDPGRPWAEAIAVRGDRLTAVGTTADITRLATDTTRRIDGAGRLVVPGFIDTHTHFLVGGFRLASVQLRDAHTRAEFVARIAAYVTRMPKGTWITGGDWDHQLWGGVVPHRDWIDEATPDHPVWVNRLDGHMALANSAALRAAGITAATRAVDGGQIDRDANGTPTGLLRDNAMALVDTVVPPPAASEDDRALDAAMTYVAAQGVTSVHNMGTWDELAAFERAAKAGTLRTRIYAATPLDDWARLRDAIRSRRFGGADGHGSDWLRVGGLKGFVDGSLGSHTAAFEAPFADTPGERGFFVNSEADLLRWIRDADAAQLHVMVHAIGDRANRTLLDIYARVARENGPRDRRFRIEHAQHLAPADIPRFAALGVVPSMQPYHAIDDGRWAETVIGEERARGTYAFRSLLDAGARLAFGSDWFVAPPTPIEGIYAAVTRRTLDDARPGGWVPEQRITVEDAIRAYTSAAAYASFEEGRKGMLRDGYLADFVVLDRNLFELAPEHLRDARVAITVVGGKVVHGS